MAIFKHISLLLILLIFSTDKELIIFNTFGRICFLSLFIILKKMKVMDVR